MDVLSVGSDDEDDQGGSQTVGHIDNVETPPPLLTIGSVLDQLPKLKSGK